MKIYTRRGDDGSTGLFGGARVNKADPQVEAYGLLDELNAVVGWARVPALPESVDAVLAEVQDACFRLGAWLASAKGADPGVVAPGTAEIEALELAIDGLEVGLEPLKHFVLPGGSEAGARLHVARTVARRVERALVALGPDAPIPEHALSWTNRLSDYLFVAARAANRSAGAAEQPWRPGT